MQSVSDTMGPAGVGFQRGSVKSMTPDRLQTLPSKSLVYWVRGVGPDRNLVENVPWRETCQREGISNEADLAAMWESRGAILPSPHCAGSPSGQGGCSLSMAGKAQMPNLKQGAHEAFLL